jgi:hypothetical protein
MVSNGEQNILPPHPLEARSKFNLADGEGVAEMEGAVHVSVRERAEPFGVLGVHVGHGLVGREEFGVRRNAFGERSVGIEDARGLP